MRAARTPTPPLRIHQGPPFLPIATATPVPFLETGPPSNSEEKDGFVQTMRQLFLGQQSRLTVAKVSKAASEPEDDPAWLSPDAAAKKLAAAGFHSKNALAAADAAVHLCHLSLVEVERASSGILRASFHPLPCEGVAHAFSNAP